MKDSREKKGETFLRMIFFYENFLNMSRDTEIVYDMGDMMQKKNC